MRALIFDSWFDIYRGAVVMVRVMEGRITPTMHIRLCANDEVYEVEASRRADAQDAVIVPELAAGDVGFIVANIKRVADARVGDTVIEADRPAALFRDLKPSSRWSSPAFILLVPTITKFCAMPCPKLQLNDAAFFYEPENSVALGFGFRCGFLGLLHMEIVQERLEREFNIDLITTAPSVRYRITTTANEVLEVDSPTQASPPTR